MSNYYNDQINDRIYDAATDAADLVTDSLTDSRLYVDVDSLVIYLCDQLRANYPDVGG